MTQASPVGAKPRSDPIAGRAVSTTVTSSTTTNCATHRTASPPRVADLFPVNGLMSETYPAATDLQPAKVVSVETEVGIARPPGIRELPIVAGHLALDFANTVDDPLGRERWDHIPDHPNLVTWGERVGIVDARQAAVLRRAAAEDPEAAAAAVRDAVALRRAVNDVFGAVVDGTPLDDGWARLRPFAAAATARAELTA